MDLEIKTRLAAFEWLSEQVAIYGDVLPRTLLLRGFSIDGMQITLISQKGIWKPRVFEKVPISITTAPKGPYQDEMRDFLYYRYQGTDPYHLDNVGLRKAMTTGTPLIYFFGFVPGRYLPVWPVYIINDNPRALTFTVAVDESRQIQSWSDNEVLGSDQDSEIRRRYVTADARVRLHQRSFRERILAAYNQHCAFCRIAHIELLDAAHIIPDGEVGGEPLVENGMSLCKIHHAAFDQNFIGVSPDYGIKIRRDLLEETDGPMLKHGIQELHQGKLYLPSAKKNWPDRDRLAVRFEQFQKVV
jgi:putative restriction endonuclease